MIGLWSEHAAGFLVGSSLLSLLTVGLPMLIMPLAWEERFGWPIPQATDGRNLSTYLGRCIGALASVQATVTLVVAHQKVLQPLLFAILIGNFALLMAVRIWGAARKTQPPSESRQTFVWAALLVLAVLFYPAG